MVVAAAGPADAAGRGLLQAECHGHRPGRNRLPSAESAGLRVQLAGLPPPAHWAIELDLPRCKYGPDDRGGPGQGARGPPGSY